MSDLPIRADLRRPQLRPAYQEIAPLALEFRNLGLTDAAIAQAFRVTGKTVAKAIRWMEDSR